MKPSEWIIVFAILATGFFGGLAALEILDHTDPLVEPVAARPAHRRHWEIDPQGQGENLSAADCRAAGRTPYYVEIDPETKFYEECLR